MAEVVAGLCGVGLIACWVWFLVSLAMLGGLWVPVAIGGALATVMATCTVVSDW